MPDYRALSTTQVRDQYLLLKDLGARSGSYSPELGLLADELVSRLLNDLPASDLPAPVEKYSPDQPRDERGRFGESAGGKASANAIAQSRSTWAAWQKGGTAKQAGVDKTIAAHQAASKALQADGRPGSRQLAAAHDRIAAMWRMQGPRHLVDVSGNPRGAVEGMLSRVEAAHAKIR